MCLNVYDFEIAKFTIPYDVNFSGFTVIFNKIFRNIKYTSWNIGS